MQHLAGNFGWQDFSLNSTTGFTSKRRLQCRLDLPPVARLRRLEAGGIAMRSCYNHFPTLNHEPTVPMRYLRSYRFLFDNAYWAINLLAATLCQAIPVVGAMVFTGYAFEMIEA